MLTTKGNLILFSRHKSNQRETRKPFCGYSNGPGKRTQREVGYSRQVIACPSKKEPPLAEKGDLSEKTPIRESRPTIRLSPTVENMGRPNLLSCQFDKGGTKNTLFLFFVFRKGNTTPTTHIHRSKSNMHEIITPSVMDSSEGE
eukprot:gene5740-4101_t